MFPNQAVFQKFHKAPIKLEMSIIELDQTIFHFPQNRWFCAAGAVLTSTNGLTEIAFYI